MYDFFHTTLAGLIHTAHATSLSVRLPVINGTGPGSSPASFVNYLVVFAIAFVGFAAIVGIIWGGITYLTAAGNASKASDGTDRIKSSVLGLVLVLAAIAILYTINPSLTILRNPAIPIVSVPVVQNIPPQTPGGCTLVNAYWSTNQICYNDATKAYDQVIMAADGQNCDGWGASFNIVDTSTGVTIETLGGIFQGNQLQVSWPPKKIGTYTFNVIAGSATAQTQAFSGQLLVSDGPCIVVGGACPPGGAAQPINYSAYAIKNNNTPHCKRGCGHGWVECKDPDCAVDDRVGQSCQEANANASRGVPVFAPFSGKVVARQSLGFSSGAEFGNYITITSQGLPCNSPDPTRLGDPFCALLAHIEPSVRVGDAVRAGQQVGALTVWTCGPTTFGPHLHFELKMNNQWIVGNGGNAFDGTATVPASLLYTIDRNQRAALTACIP